MIRVPSGLSCFLFVLVRHLFCFIFFFDLVLFAVIVHPGGIEPLALLPPSLRSV